MTAAALRSNDPQILKRWAAEDLAIRIGLLRECPYHGQPFRAERKGSTVQALAAGLIDPLDPLVKVFNGNARELLATLERVTGEYSQQCEYCAASEQEEFD